MPGLTQYEVFISHCTDDLEWSWKLVKRLDEEEWEGRKLKVFFAPRDIHHGKPNRLEIQEALLASCVVVFVMTPASLDSKWVKSELLMADIIMLERGKDCLIPVLHKPCDPPDHNPPLWIRVFCRINFTKGEFEINYQKLVAAIKNMLREGCCPSQPTDAHPVRLVGFTPPPRLTGFVPRHNDEGQDLLELLKEELDPNKNQRVALWGPGGIGKTTLAIMIADHLYEDFSGRVVWINARLRTNFSLSDMLDVIARRLGRGNLHAFGLEQKKEEVSAMVQESPTLIVLDNFEMIEVKEQRNCEEWLAENISCPVLITTRERVNSPLYIAVKTRNIAVGKMTLAEAREFLTILIKQEEHEKSVFVGLNHDRIIKAAEYNPLVLRWIVGQIVGAQNPEDVLNELAQGKGDAAEHVFDLSFNLPQVEDDGRDVLLALYLFSFSASRPALAWVAGLGDDIDRFNKAVKKLSELWLVETRENNKKFIVKGLTRERIKKHLDESGRAEEFRQRFIHYFLKYAEEHSKHSAEDFRALEDEKENGEAAMNMALQHKDWKSVIKFFAALREFLDRHNYWSDLIRLSERTLDAAQQAIEEGLIANDAELNNLVKQIPNIIGIEHQNRDLARQTYLEAIRFYKSKWKDTQKGPEERKKYAYRLGITSHQIGVMRQYEIEPRKAQGWYRWAWRFLEESGSKRGMGAILNNLGVIAEEKGNIEEAADLYRQALDIFNGLKPPSSYAIIALKNLKRVESHSS